jgi:hypothetical protein
MENILKDCPGDAVGKLQVKGVFLAWRGKEWV